MNGFSTGEEDSRGPTDQICCLVDDGDVCRNAAGNASYSKRIQKTVIQRRLKLSIDPQVSSRGTNGCAFGDLCGLMAIMLHNSFSLSLTKQSASNLFFVYIYTLPRPNTSTFVIFIKHGYSAQGRNVDERIRKTIAMKRTPICPKWICINCK